MVLTMGPVTTDSSTSDKTQQCEGKGYGGVLGREGGGEE